MDKFLKRHDLSYRVPTSIAQRPPIDFQEKIIDFLLFVEGLRGKHGYTQIYAADEIAVWLDPLGGKCVELIGSKQVNYF